jgi:hypothetical protein
MPSSLEPAIAKFDVRPSDSVLDSIIRAVLDGRFKFVAHALAIQRIDQVSKQPALGERFIRAQPEVGIALGGARHRSSHKVTFPCAHSGEGKRLRESF